MPYKYPFKDADEGTIAIVWSKADEIPGQDPDVWRRDICRTRMKYSEHGKTSKYGWEIDHVKPLEIGRAHV